MNEDFIKSYNDKSDERYFLEVDVQYPENLHNLHNDLPFLPERMKTEKDERLVANFHDKIEFYTHKKFKTSIKPWISVEKVHRIIKFNQKTLLNSYFDTNSDLTKKAKNDLKKDFFSSWWIK